MTTLKKRLMGAVALTVLSFAVLGPNVAEAGTTSGTFTVSTTVNSPCTLTTSNLTFPNYNSGSSTPVSGSADFIIACPGASAASPDPINITFTTASGSFAMTNGGNSLNYGLCDGALCSSAYAPGVKGPWIPVVSNPQTYTVYGSIPGNQAIPGGVVYQQLVTATMEF